MEQGTMIDHRYRIVRPLGGGGMANVYQAFDTYLNRDVTLKMIRLDYRDQPDAVERFQREAKAATALINEHIVQVYDAGEFNGSSYLVMEYVDGMDLKNYIQEHFPIPYQQVVDIMEQILAAVEVAHEAGIIHRDLKPQNILVDQNGQIKITDFGIATAIRTNTLTQAHQVIGSIHYLAPELPIGQRASFRSDLYALGVILYELLTNQVPYQGDTPDQVAYMHGNMPMPFVRDFDSDIPQPLENVILRATAKNPEDRYVSAASMAEDLKTSLSKRRAHEDRFVPVTSDETRIVDTDLADRPYVADPEVLTDPEEGKSVTDQIIDYAKQGDSVATIAAKVDRTPKYVRQVLAKNGIKYKSGKKIAVALLALVLFLGGVAGVAYYAGNYVSVPDVSNMSASQAESKLSDAGLSTTSPTYTTSKTVSKGDVVKTKPGSGSKVQKGKSIQLVISSGGDTVSLSDFTGWTYGDAASQLNSQGFTVKKKTQSSNDVPTGEVISQSVSAGSSVDPSQTTVVLTVSTGAAKVDLPNLVGQSQGDAINWANQNHVQLSFTNQSSNQPNGQVIAQDTMPGSQFSTNKTLSLTISTGNSSNSSSSSSASSSSSQSSAASSSSTKQN
ncbi:Stk1 family PASTA domain-containing Ser/Thr kinase [Fructobacillus ficulneus]|uniref:non-specific serine/threonine protein kinase n=1 Tax=Fructobacillus ficulneus TaxID=157463 RepID=A0A0K8MHP5_9LACO|nr:Stk1 family PASTA domain-containing Ser/Thr kinase [Fructobacillus ficulneus]GAP00076.1 serine/threonine protein kinase [Fructobacillus ficulneus]